MENQTTALYIPTSDRFRELIEGLNVITYEFDIPKHRFTYVSRQAESILGYSAEQWFGIGFWFNHLHPEDRGWASEFSKRQTIHLKDHDYEYRMIASDGAIIWFRDITSVNSENGIPKTLQGVLIDISQRKKTETARKNAEEALKNSEEQFRSIFENAPIGMSLNSMDGQFLKVNCAFCRTVGYSRDELYKMTFKDITHPDDLKENLELLNSAVENKQDNYELEKRYITKDKEIVHVSIHVNILKDAEGNPARLVAQIVDITERRVAAEKLKDTQTRLAAILNNLPNVVFYENTPEKQFISPNVYEMLGYNSEDFYINGALFDSLIHPEDLERVVTGHNAWIKNGANGIYKELFRIKRKDDGYIWLEDHMFKVKRADGKSYVLGVMIDVTEQKNSEEKMSSSLEEKELLLKEIHHRVKNNLQVISSLLKLQASYVTDKEALGVLTESQNRVQSMALIHQKLYQSKDLGNIDLKEYINQLALNIFHSYKINTDVIKLELNSSEIKLGIDYAIPCGLIANELITNALKHAFPNGSSGTITITLSKENTNHYLISIRDDGAGFPKNVDFKNTSSLGLQLVNTLVDQIDGTVEMESHKDTDKGTCFTVRFSIQNGDSSAG